MKSMKQFKKNPGNQIQNPAGKKGSQNPSNVQKGNTESWQTDGAGDRGAGGTETGYNLAENKETSRT